MVDHSHRVLIVEDDYAFRWSLAMRFQRRRIEADVAETVAEAHELIEKHQYCTVLLDLRMGNVDGAALLDAISERANRPNVTIVTGYPDVWERVRKTHRTDVVTATIFKPADVDTVIDTALKNCH